MTALITGFPKLLSRRLAGSILAGDPAAEVALLAEAHHEQALRTFIATLPAGRAWPFIGEAASMHLGLSTPEFRELTEVCTDILHAAESNDFDADRPTLERINREGTRAMVELARDCKNLRRLTHFSTIFVSGERTGVISEDELATGQSFRNGYEESKFEAELIVRRAMGQVPATILRPSIVVGERDGAYSLLLLLLSSPLQGALPGAPLNVIGLDFAVAASLLLHRDPRAAGRTVHLVDPHPSSVRRVYELFAHRSGRKLPQLRPNLGTSLLDRLFKQQRAALKYAGHLAFHSSRNLLELLADTGLSCPPVDSLLDDLVRDAQAKTV